MLIANGYMDGVSGLAGMCYKECVVKDGKIPPLKAEFFQIIILLSEKLMKLALLAVLATSSQISYSCEFLYGTWKSDMKKSYDYAAKNPNIQSKQLDFVKYAFGHMMITFSESTLEVHETEDIKVIIDGKNYPFAFDAAKSAVNYKTCTKELIEVETEYSGVKDTYQYAVVNENLFWVKLESEVSREYFRRVR